MSLPQLKPSGLHHRGLGNVEGALGTPQQEFIQHDAFPKHNPAR